jgi:hypothetical protein
VAEAVNMTLLPELAKPPQRLDVRDLMSRRCFVMYV